VELILGLDVGTTGIRAVAYDHDASALFSASRELPTSFPSPGLVEQDPLVIGNLSRQVLAEVGARAASLGHVVSALGITNQRETTVAFDRASGDVRRPALVWQDRRTAEQCHQLELSGYAGVVRDTTGLVLDPYFSATKMQWLVENGGIDGFTSPGLATVDAYLVWLLTGGKNTSHFATEPSNASRTSLMDLASGQWSSEMSDVFGVPLELLPTLQPSASIFGEVSGDVVPEIAGVAITGILGDQQAALFGQACFDEGMVKATYGTGAFVLANAGTVVPPVVDGLVSTLAWDLGDVGPRHYALEGSAFVAGAAIQWLRDELGIIDDARDVGPLANSVDSAGGVIFVPAFTGLGSPFWRPHARGVLMGLSVGTSRAQIARAVVESLAFQVRAMTDAFRRGGVTLRELRADGGAAAMDLLIQLQATNSNLSVRRSTSLEATARGAATIAGLASGYWSSLDELAERWSFSLASEPDLAAKPLIDATYEAWLRGVDRSVPGELAGSNTSQ